MGSNGLNVVNASNENKSPSQKVLHNETIRTRPRTRKSESRRQLPNANSSDSPSKDQDSLQDAEDGVEETSDETADEVEDSREADVDVDVQRHEEAGADGQDGREENLDADKDVGNKTITAGDEGRNIDVGEDGSIDSAKVVADGSSDGDKDLGDGIDIEASSVKLDKVPLSRLDPNGGGNVGVDGQGIETAGQGGDADVDVGRDVDDRSDIATQDFDLGLDVSEDGQDVQVPLLDGDESEVTLDFGERCGEHGAHEGESEEQ